MTGRALIASLLTLAATSLPGAGATAEEGSPVGEAEPAAKAPKPEPPDPPSDPAPADPSWRPPAAEKDDADWLQLVSGEWVRGNIELINDETVYFDSDELDDLEIDWSDVARLRSPHQNSYRFEDAERRETIVTGTAAMREGVIRIDTGSGIQEFPRRQLLSMIEGELRELNYWSFKATLGLTVRSGNSDQTDFNVFAQLKRETPVTRGTLTYESAYSVVDQNEATNNQRLGAIFAYYLSKRLFVQLPTAEAYRDRLQNIDLRTTVGAAVGYDLADRPKMEWNVTAGAGYQRTDYDAAPPGEDDPADDAALLFGTVLELDPWSDIEWDTNYSLAVVVTDLDKTNHHLTSILSFDIWGPLDLDVTFAWDRIENPVRDDDGELPERNDYRLTVGLGIDI